MMTTGELHAWEPLDVGLEVRWTMCSVNVNVDIAQI